MAKRRKLAGDSLSHLSLIEDIGSLISHSQNLQEALRSIVAIVAERTETEVCSLYLLDSQKNRLTLYATMGLNPESVGKVTMGVDEGLTGLVIERMTPIMVVDAQAHPRYKYFPETGEERYHSFLGVPLLEKKEAIGVLVVQTSRRREFSRDEIRLLKAISAQVSGIIVQARLAASLESKERERREYRKRLASALGRLRSYEGGREGAGRSPSHKWRGRLTGTSASPGFGRGVAHLLSPRLDLEAVKAERSRRPDRELERFRAAVEKGIEQIDDLKRRMSPFLAKDEVDVFDVHRLILEDPALIDQIKRKIQKEKYVAEFAVSSVFIQYLRSFAEIEDTYLREREVDVRDVAQRILENLSGNQKEAEQLPENAVLVAEELSSADLTLLEGGRFRGIVLATGGATSHASILAKSFEIPTVVGVDGVLDRVHTGDSLIVDGNSGVAYINPSLEVIREYDRLESEYRALSTELGELRDLPAETRDGHRVALYANVGLLSDVAFAQLHGAQGIGLYRTEVHFLSHVDFPTEEEQYDLYRRVTETMSGKPVTVRTLDIGADKYPPYMRRAAPEANPFLGWRSIRVSLEMVEIFKTQLRAIFRAGVSARVRLLIPMVSSLEEILKVKEIIAEVREELGRQGIPHDDRMHLGIMVEVPAAVHLAPSFIREVDFVSIGTNDLIQYLLAVDRNNRKVANLYEPLHPAVLHALHSTIEAAKKEGKRVGMCGEMAGDPLCTILLLGMGLEEFSMGPLFIPVAKKIIRSVSYQTARNCAQTALQMDTVADIKKYLFEQMRDLGMVELVELYH
jgi:phosphotransferase system enzyme I (PtsP)